MHIRRDFSHPVKCRTKCRRLFLFLGVFCERILAFLSQFWVFHSSSTRFVEGFPTDFEWNLWEKPRRGGIFPQGYPQAVDNPPCGNET
jgi:hypothetical protein